jgi:cytochrome c-type biogenesis protein CcmH
MAAVLRQIAAERPSDPEPLRNLALAELASDQPMEAVQALERAIALAPARAELWAALGQAELGAQNGEASADSRAAFQRALALDPANADARYYLARARIAGGDSAGGLADWRALSAALAAGDPRKAALEQEIREVTATGVLPLTAEASAAPQTGAPAVGAAQIQAMVDGLAAQLKANPDDPAGWVRLVRAYAVLGETDRRDAAVSEARRRFAGKPDVLAAITTAAVPPP